MRALPARAKRVVVADTAVRVTLPVPDEIEKVGPMPVVGEMVSMITTVLPSTLATNPLSLALMRAARPAATSASGTFSRTTCSWTLVPRLTVTFSPTCADCGTPLTITVPPSIAVARAAPAARDGMSKMVAPSTTRVAPRAAASNPEVSVIFCARAASTRARVCPSWTTWLNGAAAPATVTCQVSPATGTPCAVPTVEAPDATEAVSANCRDAS